MQTSNEMLKLENRKNEIAGKIINLQNNEIFEVLKGQITTIGRNVNNDEGHISIKLPQISRAHCQLFYESNELYIKDLNSKNGIKVNGKKVDEKVKFSDADILEIAHLKFQIEIIKEEKRVYVCNGIYAYYETVINSKKLCLEIENQEDVIDFKRKMLENNNIDGVLGISCLKNVVNEIVYYEVDSKESLLNYLERKKEIGKIEFINILSNIYNNMTRCKDYLLKIDNFIIKPEFVFLSDDKSKTNLVYLPVKHSMDISSEFKKLMETMMMYLEKETEDKFPYKLNGFIETENMDINQVVQYLRLEGSEEDKNVLSSNIETIDSKEKTKTQKVNVREILIKNKEIIILQILGLVIYGLVVVKTNLQIYTYVALAIFLAIAETYLTRYYKIEE